MVTSRTTIFSATALAAAITSAIAGPSPEPYNGQQVIHYNSLVKRSPTPWWHPIRALKARFGGGGGASAQGYASTDPSAQAAGGYQRLVKREAEPMSGMGHGGGHGHGRGHGHHGRHGKHRRHHRHHRHRHGKAHHRASVATPMDPSGASAGGMGSGAGMGGGTGGGASSGMGSSSMAGSGAPAA